jgi:radical SAM superfamily enzyme YgiQ (UPF0313 family)
VKVLIVSAWQDRFRGDERARRFPSLSAIHLAALCPNGVTVEVRHEHARAVDPEDVDADLVAITATTGGSGRMYELADRLRARGHSVILGGTHASLCPEEASAHADAVAVGDAELSFPRMLADFERGALRGIYRQEAGLPLSGLPTPRYDLLEESFRFRCFVQATRGCPFDCTFCTLKQLDRGFRARPVDEVVRDIEACDGRTWLQRKMVWFWDDNLTADRAYARRLFAALRPLRRWWWTQASIDVAQDADLLRLAAESGCLAVFVGLESFSASNLLQVRKGPNKVADYRRAIRAFHDAGIAVQAGIIVGLDDDTPETIRLIPEAVQALGVDLAFLNLVTPFPATPLRRELAAAGRLLDRPWSQHDAAHVTHRPARMTPGELERAYWAAYADLHSPRRAVQRLVGCTATRRLPAFLLNGYADGLMAFENLFRPDGPLAGESPEAESRDTTHECPASSRLHAEASAPEL